MEGRIFDPLNGKSDLKNGIIKFIGNPQERIEEDYLRILRYFRFYIQYSKKNYDENIIQQVKRHINGLNKISNERIYDEIKKILVLDNAFSLFSNNISKEIFLNIFPQFKHYERLKVLSTLNKTLRSKYDANLILALLIMDETQEYEYFCHKYKTSNNTKNRFKNISIHFENIKNKKFYSEENIKKLIYLLDKDYVKDLLLFSICVNKKIKDLQIEKLLNYVDYSNKPKFHISGEDLKEYGYETGETLGKKLKLLEKKWIENNFKLDKKMLEKSLNKISKN